MTIFSAVSAFALGAALVAATSQANIPVTIDETLIGKQVFAADTGEEIGTVASVSADDAARPGSHRHQPVR